MLFGLSMKKILASRGYAHRGEDEEFSSHGNYARNMQYVYSKEVTGSAGRVVDLIFLSADLSSERIVIGFFRENVSIENGIIENTSVSIPLKKFSHEEFEEQLNRLIPKEGSLKGDKDMPTIF